MAIKEVVEVTCGKCNKRLAHVDGLPEGTVYLIDSHHVAYECPACGYYGPHNWKEKK